MPNLQSSKYVFIVEKSKIDVFIEYLHSYDFEIRYYPCEYPQDKYPIFIQKILNTSWPKYALLNTEQMTKQEWIIYFTNLKNTLTSLPHIFDYSLSNIQIFSKLGIAAYHLPYKYNINEVHTLLTLRKTTKKEYDICIIGAGDTRNQAATNLREVGFKVLHITNLYADERDKEVAKCEILVNIHFGQEFRIFEEIRCRRWLYAGMTIISESNAYDSYLNSEINLIITPPETLVETIKKYFSIEYQQLDTMSKNTAKEQVFCFWTDTNALSETRFASVQNMEKTLGVPVHFVTHNTLQNWILREHPLHEAYQYLSAVHRSDYLRCYFMHHYGGGYTDIKQHYESWKAYFKEVNENPNIDIIGYQEIGPNGIAGVSDKDLYQKMCLAYKEMIGCGCFISKPDTQITREWYFEVNSILDSKLSELKKFPAKHARDCVGSGSGYPISWTEIMGNIFHPLIYKYRNHVSINLPKANFNDYK